MHTDDFDRQRNRGGREGVERDSNSVEEGEKGAVSLHLMSNNRYMYRDGK